MSEPFIEEQGQNSKIDTNLTDNITKQAWYGEVTSLDNVFESTKKYFDATGNWSDPLDTLYKYLRADGTWAAPSSEYKFLDENLQWSGMELPPPAVELSDYTLTIDESIMDSMDMITYQNAISDHAVGWDNWKDEWIFADIKPCIVKDGKVQYYLQRDDYTKKENGTASVLTGADGDVMVQFPFFGWHIEKNGNVITVSITDEPNKYGYVYYAHSLDDEGDCDYVYIGAYKANTKKQDDNKIYCVSKPYTIRSSRAELPSGPGNEDYPYYNFENDANKMSDARKRCSNKGDGYQLYSYYLQLMLIILYFFVYKDANLYGNFCNYFPYTNGYSDIIFAVNDSAPFFKNYSYRDNKATYDKIFAVSYDSSARDLRTASFDCKIFGLDIPVQSSYKLEYIDGLVQSGHFYDSDGIEDNTLTYYTCWKNFDCNPNKLQFKISSVTLDDKNDNEDQLMTYERIIGGGTNMLGTNEFAFLPSVIRSTGNVQKYYSFDKKLWENCTYGYGSMTKFYCWSDIKVLPDNAINGVNMFGYNNDAINGSSECSLNMLGLSGVNNYYAISNADGSDIENPSPSEGYVRLAYKHTKNTNQLKVIVKLTTLSGEELTTPEATFYIALFSEEERTNRVSNIIPLVYNNSSQEYAMFLNLDTTKTYYVSLVDEQGAPIDNGVTDDGGVYGAIFPDGNEIDPKMFTSNTYTLESEIVFSNLPSEY